MILRGKDFGTSSDCSEVGVFVKVIYVCRLQLRHILSFLSADAPVSIGLSPQMRPIKLELFYNPGVSPIHSKIGVQ